MNATLVFGLIAFSGQISEVKSYNPEPTKTELKATNRASIKRAAYFKSNYPIPDFTFLESSDSKSAGFIFYLVRYENHIKVKLKSNLTETATVQNRGKDFLKLHLFQNYAASESDSHKG